MRTDSKQIGIDDHNLWIVDDRLAFYDYFTSDKPFNTFTDSESEERPDLVFFYDSCIAWREKEKAADSIVLIEFKRPGRENYTASDNPLRQVIKYVKEFKGKKTIRDRKGAVISGITEKTAFHCYIVADLTENFQEHLSGFPLSFTPDGKGMFGYTDNPRAFVEIISYQKLLDDAQQRNSIFFTKLGLHELSG